MLTMRIFEKSVRMTRFDGVLSARGFSRKKTLKILFCTLFSENYAMLQITLYEIIIKKKFNFSGLVVYFKVFLDM